MDRRALYALLLLPFAGTLVPAWYSRAAPALFGFPFFYWYQIVWVVLSALIVWAVYAMTRRRPE